MFETYKFIGQRTNWIHHNIYQCLRHICIHLDTVGTIPNNNRLLPISFYKKFHHQTQKKFLKLYRNFAKVAKQHTVTERNKFLFVFRLQNKIEKMLRDPSFWITRNVKNIQKLIDATKPITHYGFDILKNGMTAPRYEHYDYIYQHINFCPFCGLSLLNHRTVHNEDYDHYLDKDHYPLAAANLMNLVPMCQPCNQRHKGTQNIIKKNIAFRKAFFPYGTKQTDLTLLDSKLFNSHGVPDWIIGFNPKTPESNTWNEVFTIHERYKQSVLPKRYDQFLAELLDLFKLGNITKQSSDQDIKNYLISKAYPYFVRNRQMASPSLIDCKIAELFVENIDSNPAIIAMLRYGL